MFNFFEATLKFNPVYNVYIRAKKHDIYCFLILL